MVFPDKYWAYSKSKNSGLTDKVLDELDSFIKSNSRRIKNFVLITDGEVLYNESFNGGVENALYYQQSITKSITSLVLGIAIDKGYIESENDYISTYIPRYNKELKIKHLLQMSSGLKCKSQKVSSTRGFSYYTEAIGTLLADIVINSNNPLEALIDIPIEDLGNKFCYNNVSTIFIIELLKQVLDIPYEVFVDKYIIKPLGIKEYKWDSSTKYKGAHILLKTLDLARIGLLMLNKGLWKNEQIVSKNWVIRSVTPGFVDFYGYYWWVDDKHKLFYAAGKGGQGLVCIPDKKNCYCRKLSYKSRLKLRHDS